MSINPLNDQVKIMTRICTKYKMREKILICQKDCTIYVTRFLTIITITKRKKNY